MKKELIAMNEGKAVVIDHALLAIIGAEDATALELTTDGARLILSPVREDARPAVRNVITQGSEAVAGRSEMAVRASVVSAPTPEILQSDFDPKDPKDSARLIELLQERHGFRQEHFQRLHHFSHRANLTTHLAYCGGTTRFRAQTNVIVAQRMLLCLQLRERGERWDAAIAAARSRFPLPGIREDS